MLNRTKVWAILCLVLSTGLWANGAIISQSEREIAIRFEIQELDTRTLTQENISYTLLNYAGARLLFRAGAPVVPYTITGVAIPPNATVSWQYEIVAQRELNGLDLLPAVFVNDLRAENRLPQDESIYRSAAPYPGEVVEVSEPYTFRNMRVVDIKVYPVQYHPAEQRVRVLHRINLRLQLSQSRVSSTPVPHSMEEADVLRHRLLNFDQARQWALPRRSSLQRQTVDYDFSVGDWFRIPVTEEGVYRLTGSFLQSQAPNSGAIDISTIQLFNHGGMELPINVNRPRPQDLNEVAVEVQDQNGNGLLDANDAVLFYGRALSGYVLNPAYGQITHHVNPYATVNYYLLTFNQRPGKRIATIPSPSVAGAVAATSFTDRRYFYQDNYNILQSGLDWYWRRFQGTAQQDEISFQLPQNLVPVPGTFKIRLKGGSGSHYYDNPRLPYSYTFNLALNNANLVENVRFTAERDQVLEISTSALVSGENHLRVDYTGNQEGCFAFIDYFEAEFARSFVAENNFLKFDYPITPNAVEFRISGLPGGTHRVWDISDFANIRQIDPLQNGSTVRFQDVAQQGTVNRQYYVFADGGIRTVDQAERIENRPNLRDPNRRARLLLITADEFYEAAEAWEDFKETDIRNPLETERIRVSDIFREFSSYVPDPTAIRDFIKYAYENWGSNDADPANSRPIYVQLIGDGSYDYRNITLTNYVNRIPVFEVTAFDDIISRVTDHFFTAIHNSSDSPSNLDPQLAIARFPANSVAEINNYVRKMKEYSLAYTNPNELKAGWQTTFTFVADDQCAGSNACNEWFHLDQTEKIIRGNLSRGYRGSPRKFEFKKVYLVDYETVAGGLGRQKPKAARDLLDQVNRGTLIINYFGHGDPNTWAHEQVLTKSRDLPLIQNGTTLPLWIAATCTWGKYDDPNVPSMAEEMVWSQSGGIASLAASRATFAFENLNFVQDLFWQLFNNGSDNQRSRPVGDAMVMSLTGDHNDQKYHLFGDVALQLADPEYLVRIDNISADTLKALSRVSVDASVVDMNGNLLSDFNGKALIRVFDAVDSLRSLGVNYQYQGGTVFKGVVSVTNGRIENASFIVPKSIKYKNSRTGRMSIYAWSEVSRDAVGYNDQLLFLGTASQISDAAGPRVRVFFPDQPDFFDGDYVRQQAELVVELDDESGINLTGEVGHRIELVIDGSIKKDVTEFFVYDEDSYTSGKLSYTLPVLANGTHTLIIRAWDNLNNSTEQQISFTTASARELTVDRVVNYPNPFVDETTFTFQFQSPNGIADATIKIYTVTGRLIQEIKDIARPGFNKIRWDGRDADGAVLANGVYLYKITINDGEKTVEKIDKLAITR